RLILLRRGGQRIQAGLRGGLLSPDRLQPGAGLCGPIPRRLGLCLFPGQVVVSRSTQRGDDAGQGEALQPCHVVLLGLVLRAVLRDLALHLLGPLMKVVAALADDLVLARMLGRVGEPLLDLRRLGAEPPVLAHELPPPPCVPVSRAVRSAVCPVSRVTVTGHHCSIGTQPFVPNRRPSRGPPVTRDARETGGG